MYRDAVLSHNRKYRYQLVRIWDSKLPTVAWILLNPSKADEKEDDATVRRCIRFATRWGCGGIEIYNLFAFRSTDPRRLLEVADPIGPNNDRFLAELAQNRMGIVIAWGVVPKPLSGRAKRVTRRLARHAAKRLMCLGLTKGGHPKHPARLPKNTKPRLFAGLTPR